MLALALLAMSGCSLLQRGETSSAQAARPAAASPAAHREPAPAPTSTPVSSATDVLYVNGEALAVSQILDPLRQQLRDAAARGSKQEYLEFAQARCRDEVLRQVQDLLIYQEAAKSVTDQITEVLDRYVDGQIKDRVNKEFGGRQSRFERYLKDQHTSLDDYRENERKRIIGIKYLQDTIVPKIADPTRQELLDFYFQNMDQYSQPEKRQLLLIDIAKAGEPDVARRAIDEALERLRAGEPFEDVAWELSTGLHAQDGGDWSFVSSPLHGRYEEVSAALFQLSENEVSDIIETDAAFFIVKAGKIEASRAESFAAVQPQLVERYRNFQFDLLRQAQVQELLENAVIDPSEELFFAAVLRATERTYDDGSP